MVLDLVFNIPQTKNRETIALCLGRVQCITTRDTSVLVGTVDYSAKITQAITSS